MPNTSSLDQLIAHLSAGTTSLLGPADPAASRTSRQIHDIRRVAVVAGSLATMVQVIIWLMIAILGGHLDAPWWLWTLVPTVFGALALTATHRLHSQWSRS